MMIMKLKFPKDDPVFFYFGPNSEIVFKEKERYNFCFQSYYAVDDDDDAMVMASTN